MITNTDSESIQTPSPAVAPAPAPAHDILHLLRPLLACNPFYIVSAALLLYSMRCLSLDSRVFTREATQLLFNFSSFQIYELLLVGTAILLARRSIWYDSGLLIALENLLVCVPLILVSQALLLQDRIAFAFCITGCALAAIRLGALKRCVHSVNLPARLFGFGAFLLCVNLGLPVLIRALHKDANLAVWFNRGVTLNHLEWLGLAPLAMGLGLFLPGRSSDAKIQPRQPVLYAWRAFPLIALALWVAGTCAHLYCIGYVYGFSWRVSLLVPTLWMAGWICFYRNHDLDMIPEKFRNQMRKFVLCIPAMVLVMALYDGNEGMCLALTSINALIYLMLAATYRDRWAFHLCLLSVALAVGFLPQNWFLALGLKLERAEILIVSLLGCAAARVAFSRNPRAGIAGAVLASMLGFVVLPENDSTKFLATQIGVVFVLLHSLRWDDSKHVGAATARKIAAGTWIALSLLWLGNNPIAAGRGTLCLGALTLAIYLVSRLLTGTWASPVVPIAAVVIIGMASSFAGTRSAMRMPHGLLILLGSFILFAIGTLTALTRNHWNPPPQE